MQLKLNLNQDICKTMADEIYLAFDIDGTIYDAGDIVEESLRQGIETLIMNGTVKVLGVPSKNEIAATLGYPLEDIFRMLFPSFDDRKRELLSDLWTANLVKMIRAGKGRLIEGADETIRALHSRNYKMLVASNGARDYVEAILETYNFRTLFSEPFIYAEGELRNKTDIIASYLALNPERKFVMIGDRETDLHAAVGNNIPFIGCAFGHAGIDEIRDTEYIVHDFREIPAVLEVIAARQAGL